MFVRRADSAIQQWTVEFLRHIRSIHFALVTLSAGLLVIAITGREQRSNLAVKQATWLEELYTHWNDVRSKLYREGARAAELPDQHDFGIRIQSKELAQPIRFIVRLTADEFSRYELWKFPSASVMETVPRSLNDMETVWEILRKGLVVRVPAVGNASECKVSVPPRSDFGDDAELVCLVLFAYAPGSDSPVLNGEIHAIPPNRTKRFGSAVLVARNHTNSGIQGGSEFTIELRSEESNLHDIILPDSAIQEVLPWWRNEPMSTTLADLFSLSPDGNMDIDNIVSMAKGQQPKGAEVIEAMGIKIPALEITRWGTLVLLVLQSYLAVHLREFVARRKARDTCKGIAWIGLYSSPWAAAMVYASAFLLPVCAVGLLAIELPGDLPSSWPRSASLAVGITVGVASTSIGITTAMLIRRLRVDLCA